MVVTTVMIQVKAENVDDFIEATIPNHESSVGETGNRRFDLLQSTEDPTRFILYEAYDTEQSATDHKETDHYKKWRDAVAPYMEVPRKGIRYRAIRPL
jgi:autoinducer 2-degrading protein